MAEPKEPIRVQILKEGANLTNGDRDATYGDPIINLGLAGELKDLVRSRRARPMSTAEMEAMDQVLTKVARVFTGPVVKHDNYVDGSTYFAIAGEAATRFLEGTAVKTKTAIPENLSNLSAEELADRLANPNS